MRCTLQGEVGTETLQIERVTSLETMPYGARDRGDPAKI
jgi:hypothetical protein